MTIKIDVEAGLSDLMADFDKLKAKAASLNETMTGGSVGIDIKDAEKNLRELLSLVGSLNKQLASPAGAAVKPEVLESIKGTLEESAESAHSLKQILSALGKDVDVSGLDSATAKVRKHEEALKRAARAAEVLKREGLALGRGKTPGDVVDEYDRLKKSGARGTSAMRRHELPDYLAGGWQDYSINQDEAKRHHEEVLKRLGIDYAHGKPGGGVPPFMEKLSPKLAGFIGGMGAGAMNDGSMGIAGAAGTAAGTGLGMLAGSMMSGPWAPLVAMLVGGASSKILGGAGSAVDSKVGGARGEAEEYHELRMMIGATTDAFYDLRSTVRDASVGLGLTYEETVKLATVYAKISNQPKESAKTIAAEVGDAAGFARGYGIPPEVATKLFAELRHAGVSGGREDNRRLAAMIADSVAKAGTTAKMDETLSAISSFTAAAARESLTSPNVAGFAELMSSLTGLNISGLSGDPATASSIINKADAAARRGGGFGEASAANKLAMYQKFGFDALDMPGINSMGAMGTMREFLDSKTQSAEAWGKKTGDYTELERLKKIKGGMSEAELGKTDLQRSIEWFKAQAGGNKRGFVETMRLHSGLSDPEADALWQADFDPESRSGFYGRMKRLNLSDKLPLKQQAQLAQLSNAGEGDLVKQANRLAGMKLSEGDRSQLTKAMTSGSLEDKRDTVMVMTARYDKMLDQGEEARKQRADMANSLQRLATEMLPMIQTIKSALTSLVEKIAPNSEHGKQIANEREREKPYVKYAEFISDMESGDPRRMASAIDKNRGLSVAAAKAKLKALDKSILEDGVSFHNPALQDWAGRVRNATPAEAMPFAEPPPDRNRKLDDQGHRLSPNANNDEFAKIAAAKLGVPVDVIKAHLALETGHTGKSTVGDFNYGNIKAGKNWTGDYKEKLVGEQRADGSKYTELARFRSYGNVTEAAEDYAETIKRRFPKAVGAQDAGSFAGGLQAGGYATDAEYRTKFLNTHKGIARRNIPPAEVVTNVAGGDTKYMAIPPVDDPNDPARGKEQTDRLKFGKIIDPSAKGATDPMGKIDDQDAASAFDKRIPERHSSATDAPGLPQRVSFEHKVTLYDRLGNEMTDPIVQTHFNSPAWMGTPT